MNKANSQSNSKAWKKFTQCNELNKIKSEMIVRGNKHTKKKGKVKNIAYYMEAIHVGQKIAKQLNIIGKELRTEKKNSMQSTQSKTAIKNRKFHKMTTK
ncbi:hypothetical protein BDAP_000793 [Binucleata daphniae]